MSIPKKRYFIVEVNAVHAHNIAKTSSWNARVQIQANSKNDVSGNSLGLVTTSLILHPTEDKEFDNWILKKKALAKLSA